jgi:hypothetical protein
MNKYNLTLTDEKVLTETHTMLSEHLELAANGYKCSSDDLYHVLLGVAANQGTIEAVCADLVGTPDPQTIRDYINEQICVDELAQLEAQLNKALVEHIPPRTWRRPQDIAMDFHDRPYYGKAPQEEGLWVRGRAKDGTTRFYRIATTYIILNGLRFTLGIRFVLPDDTTVGVLEKLLKRVKGLHIRVRRLLLDRGFAGIEVQYHLERQQIPALIACPIRGKKGGRERCVAVAKGTALGMFSKMLRRSCRAQPTWWFVVFSRRPNGRNGSNDGRHGGFLSSFTLICRPVRYVICTAVALALKPVIVAPPKFGVGQLRLMRRTAFC